MVNNLPRYIVICNEKYLFNCGNSVKIIKPQYKDEICLSMMVTKVEKIDCMVYGVNLSTGKEQIGNPQRSPEQGNAQRLSHNGSKAASDW